MYKCGQWGLKLYIAKYYPWVYYSAEIGRDIVKGKGTNTPGRSVYL